MPRPCHELTIPAAREVFLAANSGKVVAPRRPSLMQGRDQQSPFMPTVPDRIILAPDLEISRIVTGLWQVADK